MVFCFVCLLKGKLATGIVGIAMPLFAWVGAARLAKPESWWSRRRYGVKKLARSRSRFGERYLRRHNRLSDRIA